MEVVRWFGTPRHTDFAVPCQALERTRSVARLQHVER